MIRYCLDQWNANESKLRLAITRDSKINSCEYEHLVKLVVNHILNAPSDKYDYKWQVDEIITIDNGSYQGTQLFVIPMDTYQPSEYEYLMTYVGYGSCSGCDTLLNIQNYDYDKPATEKQVNYFMQLCKDILTNMIRPYNHGWRENIDFEPVEG
jgi:hypothetical protein